MPKAINLTGHVYSRITVLKENVPTTYPRKWVCICECGNTKIISGSPLRNGATQSCGCLNKERLKETHTVHGDYGSRLYSIWHNMLQRCNNPSNDGYKYYGALGITVCITWKEYAIFKLWANAAGYSKKLTLDRKYGDKGYSPINCRWETKTTQARNQKKRNTNTSGYTGVSYVPRLDKYQAYLTIAYKKVNLGFFLTADSAAQARKTYILLNQLTGFPI